ncbi:MAG: hypothetical protein PHS14_07370 [Elusimicrobia bacterium]|nr:hypothetical protein [Elusimicrobiota bacterium]
MPRTKALPALLLLATAAASAAAGLLPDRRRSQFLNDPGYALVPYVYNLPGIGLGYGILGALTNVRGSYTDISATAFMGDANGQALGIDGIHLLDRRLILDVGGARLSRTTIQSYTQRGMSSGKNDYTLADFGDSYFLGSRLTATFLDRRAEGYVGCYGGSARLDSLRERDGAVITSARTAPRYDFTVGILGARLDLTDDYIDPRRGLRLEPSVWRTPRRSSGPDFYFTDFSATAYLPVGRRSTWAFNYFRSDAYVMSPGQTDPGELGRELGLDCAAVADAARRAECLRYLDTRAAENAHGSATGLGGYQRLRSYPEHRYRGAHAEFFGTELRWNLTDEFKPFNIYVLKDIRTAVQIALFYEAGSVADAAGALWAAARQSYGAGLRIVTASGLVYRLDLATGDEGFQPSVFFQYPWEL